MRIITNTKKKNGSLTSSLLFFSFANFTHSFMKIKLKKLMEVFIMTAAQRIRSIRLMEKMEKAYSNNNTCVEKAEDGTIKYKNNEGKVLFEVKTERA